MLAGEMGGLRPPRGVRSFPCQVLAGPRAQGGAPKAPNSPGGAGAAQSHTCCGITGETEARCLSPPNPGAVPMSSPGRGDKGHGAGAASTPHFSPHGHREPFPASGSGICSFPGSRPHKKDSEVTSQQPEVSLWTKSAPSGTGVELGAAPGAGGMPRVGSRANLGWWHLVVWRGGDSDIAGGHRGAEETEQRGGRTRGLPPPTFPLSTRPG